MKKFKPILSQDIELQLELAIFNSNRLINESVYLYEEVEFIIKHQLLHLIALPINVLDEINREEECELSYREIDNYNMIISYYISNCNLKDQFDAINSIEIHTKLIYWLDAQKSNLNNTTFKENEFDLNTKEIVRLFMELSESGIITDNKLILETYLPFIIEGTHSTIETYLKKNMGGIANDKLKDKLKKLFLKVSSSI